MFASIIEFVQLAFRHDERARAVRNVGALGSFPLSVLLTKEEPCFRHRGALRLSETWLRPCLGRQTHWHKDKAKLTELERVEVLAWLTSSVVNDLAKAMKALDGKAWLTSSNWLWNFSRS